MEAMKLPILIHPDPRLKKNCAPVADLSDDLRDLAQNMLETMYDAPGIGLAAPQVGVLDRLIVMDCIKDGDPEPMVMFNPAVLASSADLNTYEAGCLSIPAHFADVTLPAEGRVGWIGMDGNPREKDFAGLCATCVQPESDQLNGKRFIDYLGPMKRQLMTRKPAKMKRDKARG